MFREAISGHGPRFSRDIVVARQDARLQRASPATKRWKTDKTIQFRTIRGELTDLAARLRRKSNVGHFAKPGISDAHRNC
jgi:hypothetical protein